LVWGRGFEALPQGRYRDVIQSGMLVVVPVAAGGMHQGLVQEAVRVEGQTAVCSHNGVPGMVLVAVGC